MKKIATAAVLLTAIGSGAALGQGAPPGYAAWQSSWPGYAKSLPSPATSARTTITAPPNGRTAFARNGMPVPVAANVQGNARGG